jgi:hypothetical protein
MEAFEGTGVKSQVEVASKLGPPTTSSNASLTIGGNEIVHKCIVTAGRRPPWNQLGQRVAEVEPFMSPRTRNQLGLAPGAQASARSTQMSID